MIWLLCHPKLVNSASQQYSISAYRSAPPPGGAAEPAGSNLAAGLGVPALIISTNQLYEDFHRHASSSSMGWRTVANGGVENCAKAIPSNPTTDTSSGIDSPLLE